MKRILVFGAGMSATVLIEYLSAMVAISGDELLVVDNDSELLQSKTRGLENTKGQIADILNVEQRRSLINSATLVISMLPASLHLLVAKTCLACSKNLLTASYVDEEMMNLNQEIEEKGLLFLCEMGLDPGIDHMSALKIFDSIRSNGGQITSFKSHCGGLIAPESDDNPWHYKITWNPRNIVLAGSAGATYLENGEVKKIEYSELFDNCAEVNVPGLGLLAAYPNRDSLSYLDKYHLGKVNTLIRTTLRYPVFCQAWSEIVKAGLTSTTDGEEIADLRSYKDWASLKFRNAGSQDSLLQEFKAQADYLGLQSQDPLPVFAKCSADILQQLLGENLKIKPEDRDMIVMLHEVDYSIGGESLSLQSSLVVKGDDSRNTAMAKSVGLPLGIAAKLILDGKLTQKGVRIPVSPEIYEPVLAELEENGITFKETSGQ